MVFPLNLSTELKSRGRSRDLEFIDVDAQARNPHFARKRLLRAFDDLDSGLLPRLIHRSQTGCRNLPQLARPAQLDPTRGANS